MQESGAYLFHQLSYSPFSVENRKFSLLWNKGMSEPNVTGIVELADTENHTIEPKITTYIQPGLWQFQNFPIETIEIFANFPKKIS